MAWFTAFPAIFVTLTVLFVPGFIAARILGAKGWVLAIFSPIISIAEITFYGFVLSPMNIRWNPFLVFVLTLLLAIFASLGLKRAGFSFVESADSQRASVKTRTLAIALLIPIVTIAACYIIGIPEPDRFSVRFDNVFHQNVIRHIMDSTEYSPLNLSRFFSAGGGYYPDTWNLIVAYVAEFSGQSIQISTNAVVFIMAAVIWPVNALFMVHKSVRDSAIGMIFGGIACAVLPAFPFGSMLFGPIYPNMLAFILLPVCFVGCAKIAHVLPSQSTWNKRSMWLFTLVSTGTAAMSHPNALAAVVFFVIALFVAHVATQWKGKNETAKGRVIMLGAALFAATGLLYIINPSDQWSVERSPFEAVWRVLNLSHRDGGTEIIVTLFAILALYVAIKKRIQMLLACGVFFVIFAVFWVLSDSVDIKFFRFFGIMWYDDVPRLAALATMVIIPLAAYGAEHGFRLLDRIKKGKTAIVAVCCAVASACIIGGFSTDNVKTLQEYYLHMEDDSPVTGTAKQKILDAVKKYVPAGQRIIGDPATGAAFAYAKYGYPVLKLHMIGGLTADEKLLWDHYSEAASNPQVCEAIKKLNIYYALDFKGWRLNGEDYRPKGLDHISEAPGFELLESDGDNRLYKVTACH